MNVKPNNNEKFKNFLPYIILMGVVLLVFAVLSLQGSKINELTTGELIKELKNDTITEIVITPKSDESIYYITGKIEGYKDNETFSTKVIAGEY